MKTTAFAYAAFLAFASKNVSGDCLGGGLVLDGVKGCSYEALLAAYTLEFNDPVYSCSDTTPEADLWLKLGNAASLAQAQAYVKSSICAPMYSARPYVPFTKIANRGTDYDFEKNYFNGFTDWNENVETLYGINGVGQVSQNLKADSIGVSNFFAGDGSSKQVEFPSQLSNFQNCNANTAMCCWVTDRQAGDANGNCAAPNDLNCVDKDPGDNTDLCYVDHNSSNITKDATSNGEEIFSFDDDNNSDKAEGPIHCHGFAWANDPLDFTSRFKGNKLFFVSPYDHMNQRGYVRAVPGAAMCGCVEQMPVVSRADCSEVTPNEVVKFSFFSGTWSAEILTSTYTYAACQGYRGNNNNLLAYLQRLYYVDKKITSSQLAAVNKIIVGDNNCPFATAYYMQQKGYRMGYNASLALPSTFTQLGGAEGFAMDRPAADATFTTLYNISTTGIVLRTCADCDPAQRQIFVRYHNGFRAPYRFFQFLKSDKPKDYAVPIGLYGQKWAMYSTYEDALARKNPWNCNYNATAGITYNNASVFPGDCDPLGVVKTGQSKQLESSSTYSGKRDVGWYIDAPTIFIPTSQRTFGGLTTFTSLDIGEVGVTGKGSFDVSTNGFTYIRGSGGDISSASDNFHFVSHQLPEGNISVTARVKYFEQPLHTGASACLMIRKSLASGSPCFDFCYTAANTVVQLHRLADNQVKTTSTSRSAKNISLRIRKNGNIFSSQQSFDGISWSTISSNRTIPNMTSSSYYVGFGVVSRSVGYLAEAVIDNYQWAVTTNSSRRLSGIRGTV